MQLYLEEPASAEFASSTEEFAMFCALVVMMSCRFNLVLDLSESRASFVAFASTHSNMIRTTDSQFKREGRLHIEDVLAKMTID